MSTGNVNVGTQTGTQTLKFFIDGTEHNVEYTGDATANTAAQNLRDAISAAGIEGVVVGGSDANVTLTAEGKAITIATDANHTGGTAIAGTDVTATDTAASIAGKVTGTASAKVEDGRFVVEAGNTATVGNQIHVAVSGGAKDLLGSSFGGVIDTEVTDEEAIAERNKYVEQYNEVLEQIDALAKDASYKGINLLQENDLKVVFNEDRSSSIEIKGVDASSKGLGLETIEKRGWDMDAAIDDAISQVEGAISELRSMASDFGNNYSIVQTREDFTENLILGRYERRRCKHVGSADQTAAGSQLLEFGFSGFSGCIATVLIFVRKLKGKGGTCFPLFHIPRGRFFLSCFLFFTEVFVFATFVMLQK